MIVRTFSSAVYTWTPPLQRRKIDVSRRRGRELDGLTRVIALFAGAFLPSFAPSFPLALSSSCKGCGFVSFIHPGERLQGPGREWRAAARGVQG